MAKTIKRHAGGEPLPSADWNDIASSVEVVWPNAARARIVGTGPSSAPVELLPPHVIITDPPYNCVGDGTTDNTVGLALAFADADAANQAVFIPPGTYLTATINYRMQSIIGTHQDQCTLLGQASQDILHLDPTYGTFTRAGGVQRDFTLKLNDSIDASASFPTRGGIGNACYAIDWNDRSTTNPAIATRWVFDHVRYTTTSQTQGGQNNSCGIYSQNNHFSQCFIPHIFFEYLKYGWRDHYSNINLTAGTNSRDHIQIGLIHFLRCANPLRAVNWGACQIGNMVFHGPGTVNALEFLSVDTSSSGKNHDIRISVIELAGATGIGFKTDIGCFNLNIDNASISCDHSITWAANESFLRGFFPNVTVDADPKLIVTGHRNEMILTSVTPGGETYSFGRVSNLGVGNKIYHNTFQGPQVTRPYGRSAATPDTRAMHERDALSPMLGIMDPMFISGNDLLINPRSIQPGGTQVTSWDWFADSTADFGSTLRMLASTSGSIQIQDDGLNGLDGFRVGKFLPPSKVRVYIKAKVATAGTQTWNLQAPSGTTKGSVTSAAIGTGFTVISFDADLTGVAVDTALVMNGGTITGGGAAPLDIAWIMFRPWPADWPVMRQRMSADVGDAAKTLAVSDLETQRWNTPLTANRAVTLPTTNVPDGHKFHIVRTAAATGASSLNVGTGPLKALALGQYADVQWDGAAWVLTAFGSL